MQKMQQKSHYKIVCMTKVPRTAVGEIKENDAFFGAIADTDASEPWMVTLFLIDR